MVPKSVHSRESNAYRRSTNVVRQYVSATGQCSMTAGKQLHDGTEIHSAKDK